MNVHTNYQTIDDHNGKPLFVLVPIEDFKKMPNYRLIPQGDGIPQEVVENHVIKEIPLVKAWREYLGFTQTELVELTGLSQSSIARIESAKHKPRKGSLEKLAHAMGLSLQQVLTDA